MHRPIVYTQEQGRSTDFLFAAQQSMVGLSKLAKAVLGSSTLAEGLAVTPTTPASLDVNVASGQIYQMEPLEASAYGVLPADTTDTILKQGLAAAQTLSCPAPTTAGYSINYLIQATYQDVDAVPAVLPYFNSANPAQPLSGQNNSGAAQSTQRQGVCIVVVKAGAAATTGSQTTPAPDSGYVGLYVVTVAYGQTQITGSSIALYSGAPLLTETLLDKAGIADLAAGTYQIGNRAVFTSSGTFTVPPGVTKIWLDACAGGGGGGGGAGCVTTTSGVGGGGGGGGGGGQYLLGVSYAVTPGQSIPITIGAGGVGGNGGLSGNNAGKVGTSGGATSIGSIVTLTGGGYGGGGQALTADSFGAGGAGASCTSGYPPGSTGTDANYAGNGGVGASGPFGGGGGAGRGGTTGGTTGSNSYGYGSGGGGGGGSYSQGGAGGKGGNGSAGFVSIRW